MKLLKHRVEALVPKLSDVFVTILSILVEFELFDIDSDFQNWVNLLLSKSGIKISAIVIVTVDNERYLF